VVDEDDGRRHSKAQVPVLIDDPVERAKREIENGFAQFHEVEEIVEEWRDPERKPFRLRPSQIFTLHRRALDGISLFAGNTRPGPVEIQKSKHIPPGAHLIHSLLEEMCDHVNEHFETAAPLYLASYVMWRLNMWRLNWIHPFDDGNGRTSRAVSYLVLCARLGMGPLPGKRTIPDQIVENREPYFDAIEEADEAWKDGGILLTKMETLLGRLLINQLNSASL
jgi:Fic family protein